MALPSHVLGFFGQDFIQRNTSEFQSPGFRDLGTRLFLAALMLGIAALAWVRERIGLPQLAVFLAVTAFALMARRNIALWALTALPLLAIHLDPAVRKLPEPPNFRTSFGQTAGGRTWPWVLPPAVILLLLALVHGRVGSFQLIPGCLQPEDLSGRGDGAGPVAELGRVACSPPSPGADISCTPGRSRRCSSTAGLISTGKRY